MMTILWVVYISCVIVWIFPPFRQYNTRYFPYFLVLALADPFTILIHEILNADLWHGHDITTAASIVMLLSRNKIGLIIPLSLGFIIAFIFIFPLADNIMLHNIMAFNLVVIMFIVARDLVVDVKETETVNIFYAMLLLYNISGVMKVLFSVSHGKTGYLYFFITNFFQIFLAIFFSFYNSNNSKRFRLLKESKTL
jgi:hypothetical protein